MGTPLPPNEPAELCTACWGPGKPFGPGPTPLVVQVRLTSMLPGEFFTPGAEQILLTTHHLEQLQLPCQYQIEFANFRWFLRWGPFFTAMQVVHLPTAHGVFDNTLAPLCAVDIENSLPTAPGTIMFGGFANITWALEGL